MRSRVLVLACLVAGSTALAVACSGDELSGTPVAPDGGSSNGSDSSSNWDGDSSSTDGSTDKRDSGEDNGEDAGSCVGKYEAPNLNGPGPCGTVDFGEPAAAFGPVNEDAGVTYSGTALADGIYDAVSAERSSANGGSWRETFVVEGNRFTRIRQVDTGTGSGPGPISYRSGTFAYEAADGEQRIKLTYDCAKTGDDAVDAGADSLPSDAVVATDCSAQYRYGASGVRITLRRR